MEQSLKFPSIPQLSEDERAKLKHLVNNRGERAASAYLCICRYTLGRATAGFPLNGSTAALLRSRLEHVGDGFQPHEVGLTRAPVEAGAQGARQ